MQFPWEMQAGISVLQNARLCVSAPFPALGRVDEHPASSGSEGPSLRAGRLLGWLSSLKRGVETASEVPLCQNRSGIAAFLE